MGALVNNYSRLFLVIISIILISNIFVQNSVADQNDVILEFFYAESCPHCEEKEPVIDLIEDYYGDNITILRLSLNTYENKIRAFQYFDNTPGVVITNQSSGEESVFPYVQITENNLKKIIDYHLVGNYSEPAPKIDVEPYCTDTIFGRICINASELSLPFYTVVLGALDSVNPCSFFILIFLLNLLIYVKSRRRMLLIGSIFIFFSGFIYFLLMLLLLNAIRAAKTVQSPFVVTLAAGIIALILGFINIKDFFFFKKGISLSISEDKKHKLFKRMRSLVRIKQLPKLIAATVLLAIFANTYELACTLALPSIYVTNLQTIYNLTIEQSYLYLVLYNAIYVIPLIVIVLIFVKTLGRRKLSEYQGRLLKLVSGVMMGSFGVIMIFNSSLLTNMFVAVGILLFSIILSFFISFVWKRFFEKN